jgi:hypothetical protein
MLVIVSGNSRRPPRIERRDQRVDLGVTRRVPPRLGEPRAAAINPSDVKNVAGAFKASLPRVPGRDYAGVVVAGEGWVGKEVWGSGAGFGVTRDGTHAQYLVADLDSLSEKPSHLSMEEASAVGVPYLAVWPGRLIRPSSGVRGSYARPGCAAGAPVAWCLGGSTHDRRPNAHTVDRGGLRAF